MRAIVQERYGPPEEVLVLRQVDTPAIGDDRVLVRVRATSVHPDVWHAVTGRPYLLRLMGAGLRRPKDPIPGMDLAGVVAKVGPGVTQFAPGDEVFGQARVDLQWRNGGAFAEQVSVPQEALALKPKSVSFDQAAAVTGGAAPWQRATRPDLLRSLPVPQPAEEPRPGGSGPEHGRMHGRLGGDARDRQAHAGRRPDLPARAGARGDALSAAGQRPWQDSHPAMSARTPHLALLALLGWLHRSGGRCRSEQEAFHE